MKDDVLLSHMTESTMDLDMQTVNKIDQPEDFGICNFRLRDAAHAALASVDSHCEETSNESDERRSDDLLVVTWNIAAPNKNPFEYWVTDESDEYTQLMIAVERVMDRPGETDIEIGNIFTADMFNELKHELQLQKMDNLDKLDEFWEKDFRHRRAISGFLKDESIGEKRLISLPDRITNSVKVADGRTLFRPSVVSGCQDDIGTTARWWPQWKHFMFCEQIQPDRGQPHAGGPAHRRSVFSLLQNISRAKYPAITAAEEALATPLQALCLAAFDAALVHVLSAVAPDAWQPLKRSLHRTLCGDDKVGACVGILRDHYSTADVILVQEASESFAAAAAAGLPGFALLRPAAFDARRGQNSVILVRRARLAAAAARDVTDDALALLSPKRAAAGDLCVFDVPSADAAAPGRYLLASFHGDSNGRSTCPVVTAVHTLAQKEYPRHTLVMGLDANTRRPGGSPPPSPPAEPQANDFPAGPAPAPADTPAPAAAAAAAAAAPAAAAPGGGGPGVLTVAEMQALLAARGLGSCWRRGEVESAWTTCSARTFLQPQPHKAVRREHAAAGGDPQLKDWLVFSAAQMRAAAVERDNTGRRRLQGRVPPRGFPSDHAIVSAILRPLRPAAAAHAILEQP